MTSSVIYGAAAAVLFVLGAVAASLRTQVIHRLLALNVMGTAVFLFLITVAHRNADPEPDPVPHAMVLTGIVVAVSVTAFAVGLARRLGDPADARSIDDAPSRDRAT